MKVKLTLTIEEKVKEHAKAVAATRHKSVSELVEEYFESMPNTDSESTIHPRLQELCGLVAEEHVDADRVLFEAMKAKHLHD